MRFKKYILILISFSSVSVVAEDICVGWENPIEPEMRMLESLFNEKEYLNAKSRLAELDKDSQDVMVQFAVENFGRVIKGYKLRMKVIESNSEESVKEFCEFYVTEAFYHD